MRKAIAIPSSPTSALLVALRHHAYTLFRPKPIPARKSRLDTLLHPPFKSSADVRHEQDRPLMQPDRSPRRPLLTCAARHHLLRKEVHLENLSANTDA